MRRILFVANGHGETAIAGRIGEEIAAIAPVPVVLDLLALVGTGSGAAALRVVGPRATMPSGGLVAMGNVRAFARDLRAGFPALFAGQLRFLRGARARYDAVVAVGDAYALGMALCARSRTVFVGTAKSVYVAPYGAFERRLLRLAKRTFVRDEATAARLRAERVSAEAPGNVIVDLVRPGLAIGDGTWLGLLPGSREQAYADGVRLARVARELGGVRADLGALLSIAPSLDVERFAAALVADGWTRGASAECAFACRFGATSLLGWSGDLGRLFAGCVAVLGQAGTANEQAAAFGLPVIALGGDRLGGRDWYRMRQRRLLGEAFVLVPPEPVSAARAIADLLGDEGRLGRMRAAGPVRMGAPGGTAAIARAVLDVAA